MIPLAIAMLFLLYSQTSQLPQTDRIVSKVERLYRGISTDGLARGDETARGEMFVEGMRSFSHEPFLGYIPHVTGKMGAGGHSSLADSLVLFGLFGASLWFAALWRVFVGCLRHGDSQAERDALFISWIGLVLGGILNPLWHMTASLSALFALTVPPRKIAIQCKAEGTLTRPFVSAPATDGDRMAQEPRVGRNLHRPL
jgi:hypothetical protein